MPEYFDSKSSKPKKTKKTRYAGGEGIESYSSQVQRKYGGGSVKRKQSGSQLPKAGGYPGGIAGMKRHIAELENDPYYQGDAGKLVRKLARDRRENVSSGLSEKYGVKRKPKLKGKTKRGTSGDD